MHIGYIVSHYPHEAFKQDGGLGTSVFNLVNALNKKNIKVSLFNYGQDKNFKLQEQNITMYSIVLPRTSFFSWYTNRKYINRYINKIVIEEKIDILEAPDWTGITAFMKFKVPLVVRFHGSDAYFCLLSGRKQKWKNYFFEKMALNGAQAYISPTAYAKEKTCELFNLTTKKVKVIHYGLDLLKFSNDKPEKFIKNTILYLGTIIRKKGVLELAKVFNKVYEKNKKAKLVLIGSDAPDIKTGSESTFSLMGKIISPEAYKNVEYLGKLPYYETKEEIKKANLCTFPSFAETLGMVTIESMALKKAVINTSIGWGQELIDDGINGILIHPSNIESYALQILALLKDDNKIISLGQAARKKVENTFNIDTIVNENITYYKTLLK